MRLMPVTFTAARRGVLRNTRPPQGPIDREPDMYAKRLVYIVTVCSAVAAVCLMTAMAAQAGKTPTAVAVVDVVNVFDNLDEKTDKEAELQQRAAELRKEEEAKVKELENLKADLELLKAGSDAHKEKQEQMLIKSIERQTWIRVQNALLEREKGLLTLLLYRKMVTAIGNIAEGEGWDLVLFKEQPPDFERAKPEQLSTLIQVRKLIWSRDKLEITEDVIQRMNAEWKAAL